MSYAKNTKVQALRTQAEIQALLIRNGATQFAMDWTESKIAFKYKNKILRFTVPMPNRKDFEQTPTGRKRDNQTIDRELEQAIMQRWRQLLLVIKAKIEAIEIGLVTFEDEFLSYFVTKTGETIGERMKDILQDGKSKLDQITDGGDVNL